MSTFNTKKTNTPGEDKNTMLNHEGSVSHKLNALEQLFSMSQGSYMGESTFYEERDALSDYRKVEKIVSELPVEDAEYALKIAAISRASNMISFPLAILTAAFNDDKFKGNNFADADGKSKMNGYTDKIVRRAKDITDILATQISVYGFDSDGKKRTKPLPSQEKKQLKRKLESMDEYQLSKALRKGNVVSLADAIKLLHPSANPEFYKKVIENKVVFGNGKKLVQAELSKSKSNTSESTIEDVKASVATTPMLALVKNLVGLHNAKAITDETSSIICSRLNNKAEVLRSKVMPYQLYDAYKMFKRLAQTAAEKNITTSLVKAIDFSVDNVENIDGYTAYFVDLSGSMTSRVSSLSSTNAKEIASLLAAIGVKKSTCTVYAFGSRCEKVDVNSASTVVDIADKIMSRYVGCATYFDLAVRTYINDGVSHDNIVILSDGDCYGYHDGHITFADWNGNADESVNTLFKKGMVKRVFTNNLCGNKFAMINTDDYRKNIVTGFTEKYIDEINATIMLQKLAGDIRTVIDFLYDKYYPCH